MIADKKPNITKIFNETFLSLQCHYQALIATIDTRKNRLASLEAQMKALQSEIQLKSNAANADPEKLKARQEKLAKLQKKRSIIEQPLKDWVLYKRIFIRKIIIFLKMLSSFHAKNSLKK